MRQSILSHCLLVPFYFTCHILILGHFLCVYYYTQIIIGYLPPIFYLFLIWSKGRGLRKHMMPTFQFAGDQLWSLTPGTRVSKVCTDGWFGPSRARVELARISLEFGNLGVCVCVYPEKKWYYSSHVIRSHFLKVLRYSWGSRVAQAVKHLAIKPQVREPPSLCFALPHLARALSLPQIHNLNLKKKKKVIRYSWIESFLMWNSSAALRS